MTGYRRGVYREKRTTAALEADGYVVVESRGSHGPADLAAIKTGQVLLVQVKAGDTDDGGLRGAWLNELYAAAQHCGAIAVLADWPKRGRLRLRRVTGFHTKRSQTWPLEPFTTDYTQKAT